MQWLGRCLGLLAPLMLCVPGAQAQATPSDEVHSLDEEQARAHFNAGSVAFTAGNYADALSEFRKAYELSARPQLLYNIAVAADRLRYDAEALQAFEEYLRALPDAPQRSEVTGRIRVLRATLEHTSTSAGDTPSDDQEPTAHTAVQHVVLQPTILDADAPTAPSRTAPWIALVVSSAVTVTGGVLLAIALSDRASVVDAAPGVRLDEIEGAHDRVPTLSWVGGALVGLGVVGVAGSVAWLTWPSSTDSEPAALVSVGFGTVRLKGTW